MKKVANVTLITGAANIDKNIADVARKGKTLDTLIHRTAVSCVYHAREHGDSRKLADLVNAMPKASRRKALIDWIEAHVPVNKGDDDPKNNTHDSKKDGYTIKLRKGRTKDEFLLEECAVKPFWDFTPDRSTAPMTLKRAIASFERAVKKAVTEGAASQDEADMLTAALIAALPANDDGKNADSAAAA